MVDDGTRFKIWNNKHRAWWGHGGWGYTENLTAAGSYTYSETMRILASSALDLEWTATHAVPKNLAMSPEGLWFSVAFHKDGDAIRLQGKAGASQ